LILSKLFPRESKSVFHCLQDAFLHPDTTRPFPHSPAWYLRLMKNLEIAAIFGNMADLLEIKDANPFRVRAYRNARSNLESLTDNVEEIAKREALKEIPGIGKDLAAKITEYIQTGQIRAFEELKSEIPLGLVNIVTIPTIGPKTARLIFDHLGVESVEDLEMLARSEELLNVPGIKAKTLENIIRGIGLYKRRKGLFLLGRVLPIARGFCETLAPLVERVAYAGSLRRMRETVHDIDILATSNDEAGAARIMDEFVRLPQVASVLAHGPTKSSVLLSDDLQVDLRVVRPEGWGAALCYFTGSKQHNIRMRERAIKRGFKLNEYALVDSAGKNVANLEEEDVYGALDLPWIPPVLREDRGEFEASESGQLPKLVETTDIQGDLHMHTTWSDGALSTEDMVGAAMSRGYDYVAITDHSKSLGVAGGLSDEQLLDHIAEIHELDGRTPNFRVLAGTEVDIRADGSLDYSDETLSQLDFVVASIHSGLRQDKASLTHRLVRAMGNPHVRVIGHPTGRLLGDRDPYEVDFDRVMTEAVRTRTCLEVNAHYYRLDLNDVLCRKARESGVKVIISTDSHNSENLENLPYGVATAQRGWLEKEHVLNAEPVDRLLAYKSSGR
jgi:DNA polymerase (family 10)